MAVGVEIAAASLHFRGVSNAVYEHLQWQLPAAQWTCLLGASGCGKSSLLRQLAGLIDVEHTSHLDAQCSDGLPLQGRIAYMAQQDLLLPWLSVLDNVCLSERLQRGRASAQTRQRAKQLLEDVGLGAVSALLPDALSGGMRQRVALARTLMQDAPIVLMDEPFSALDAVNRHRLQALAAEQLSGKTVLLVTHDPQEALRLGQQILLFQGKPAALQSMACPGTCPPRSVDAQLGQYQAQLLQALGVAA